MSVLCVHILCLIDYELKTNLIDLRKESNECLYVCTSAFQATYTNTSNTYPAGLSIKLVNVWVMTSWLYVFFGGFY